ncbi:MAG: TPM domain-containing protein [Burkholderiaceae bacterium]|nr:TPM domain-containing protein [Burkholderiaceae bacterium]
MIRLLVLWLALALPAWAQGVLPVPPLTARVIDQTGTLPADRIAALEQKLAAFEAEAGPQIVVLLVASTAPEDISDYVQRLGDAWKIGRRDVGDGVLIVVAKDDRRIRIAPAKALEGAIPDLAARQIIDRAIAPAFRAGDYAGGLDAAVDQLIARIRGEALPAPAKKSVADTGWQVEELLMFFFIVVPVIGTVMTGVFGRKLGTLATSAFSGGIAWMVTANVLLAAGAMLASVVLVGLFGIGSSARNITRAGRHRSGPPIIFGPGGDHGGWGGGGFGGGGFGGGGGFSAGGGGDFGGGGASGDW